MAFCSNCGNKLTEAVKFCPECGAKTQIAQASQPEATMLTTTALTDTTAALNREAVILYTTDIVALESEAQSLTDQIKLFEDKMGGLHLNVNVGHPPKEPAVPVAEEWESSDSTLNVVEREVQEYLLGRTVLLHSVVTNIEYAIQQLSGDSAHGTKFYEYKKKCQSGLFRERKRKALIDCVLAQRCASEERKCENDKVDYEKRYKKYQEALERYNSIKLQAIDEVKKDRQFAATYQIEIATLQKKLQSIQSVLSTAYAANIIPSKFRNIYAVYFINDFMATSQATLEQAFLHLDLDKIQAQLAQVIQQQQQQILATIHASAQNAMAQQQISAQLGDLIDTANTSAHNSYVIAKYSSIANTHTETMAYFA
ncbi:MAG: zinc ribbon domain-containing protein [Oscillospiraceae bacterium]|nr:zinc ribbon domain-containing protein [Oscillospiraceae bacterium]